MRSTFKMLYLGTALFALAGGNAQAYAQASSSADEAGIGEIVVTAQKRVQSINSVGMSINALPANALASRGVVDTADLVKVIPGFTFARSNYGTPFYSLRGVGLFNSGIGSSPAVSVYVDEAPLAYPIMTTGASLDLERVEVLKGPQGLLFGQNSTGGAINYIAAKPTKALAAGASLSVNNYGLVDATGYVSGPLSDVVSARLAVRATQGGEWQYSVTRPSDRLGNSNLLVGRLLLDWEASDRLKVSFNVNGNRNRSDMQAPQATNIFLPPATNPAYPLLLAQPAAPRRARAADWSSSMNIDEWFAQASMRVDYELTDSVSLVSLTSYQHQKVDRFSEADGIALRDQDIHIYGKIDSFNQELRLSGRTESLQWVVGASYEHAKVKDRLNNLLGESSYASVFPDLPLITDSIGRFDNKSDTYAAFANAEFQVTPEFTVHAGARYTKNKQTGVHCTIDGPTNNNALGLVFTRLQEIYAGLGVKTTPVVPITPDICYTLDAATLSPAGNFITRINEDNVSFRFGFDYKAPGRTLIYANFSRGYKAGISSNVNSSTTIGYTPVKQERLDSLEAGFKAPLMDGALQLNGAVFYNRYFNKQIRGRIPDLLFGNIELLTNVPKSRIAGAELELLTRPVDGLTLSGGFTYLETKITGDFINFNQAGASGNFRGSPLPYTPKWQGSADAEYRWNLSERLSGFVGGSLTYRGKDNATFVVASIPSTAYKQIPYTLIDLRAGLAAPDDAWRFSVWARNLTNKYYYTSVTEFQDSRFRYAGMPRTVGMSLSFAMK